VLVMRIATGEEEEPPDTRMRIPAHREHSFRFNVNTDSGHREHGFRPS